MYFNRITTVKYHVDRIGAQARLLIKQHRHHGDEKTQHLIIKGGESVIVTENGIIKYAIGTKIIPIDCNGKNLDKK